ncbi:MAG: phospholipase [Bauldia sp.]
MHQNAPVEYRTGAKPGLTVVLVHGRTLTPDYMRALAERIGIPDIHYVLPSADGNTWYPKSFLAPLDENEPHLGGAIARYESIVAGLIGGGVDPAKLVVGGFSQGACLTAEYLAHHPRRLGGAILWTGGLIGPVGTTWPARRELDGMPAYITTSETDPFVPAARVRETVQWLIGSGAITTARVFAERPHEVSDEEIGSARWLLSGI